MAHNRTMVDLYNFKESETGANVDIITIEEGVGELGNISRPSMRNTSPYRDRVQERYNRSLSPTGSPRLKRKTAGPRSVSPFTRAGSPPYYTSRPVSKAGVREMNTKPILKSSSMKSFNTSGNNLNTSIPLPNNDTSANIDEVRRLRFENLILQSKVETLEGENNSLKEIISKQEVNNNALPDNRSITRQMSQLKLDLESANRQIDKLKKDNDDLTSQLYSLKVDRLEKPKRPEALKKDSSEDWTGCQADAIEHLCAENQRLRETIFDMNEQKLHVHRLMDQQGTPMLPRRRTDSCQLENEQLAEEKKRLLARLATEGEESRMTKEKLSKMKDEYNSALTEISSLQAQLLKYEKDGSEKSEIESSIKTLRDKYSELEEEGRRREAEHQRDMKEKEQQLQSNIDHHVQKLRDIEHEIRRVSHVCDLLCQEKDNAIQTLQKQINTNAILSRSNEQLQNTANEQSDRIRDLVYRQMRDSELITELKNDFEEVLKDRNELDERLRHEKQVHLQRLATLREQINIARISFAKIVNFLQSEGNIDNEKREELMQQLAEIDAQLSTLQRQILDIERMEAESTRVDLDDLTIQFLKKSEQCEAMQTQIGSTELDKSRLAKRTCELETNLEENKTTIETYETQFEDLRHTLHKKQIEIDTLRAQLNKVKVKLGILEEDKDTCEAKSRDLKGRVEGLQEKSDEMDLENRETKKKLHQKETLIGELRKQLADEEGKEKRKGEQISQLQKGLSRSSIQIGLLNEEMRVAVRGIFSINEQVASEELQEHLDALQEICDEMEKLELALEKTMGSKDALGDMPLRGPSGDKISQLLQELDFCKEQIGKQRHTTDPLEASTDPHQSEHTHDKLSKYEDLAQRKDSTPSANNISLPHPDPSSYHCQDSLISSGTSDSVTSPESDKSWVYPTSSQDF